MVWCYCNRLIIHFFKASFPTSSCYYIHPFLQIILVQKSSAARNWINSVPQASATTFALSSVSILFLWFWSLALTLTLSRSLLKTMACCRAKNQAGGAAGFSTKLERDCCVCVDLRLQFHAYGPTNHRGWWGGFKVEWLNSRWQAHASCLSLGPSMGLFSPMHFVPCGPRH